LFALLPHFHTMCRHYFFLWKALDTVVRTD